MIKLKYSLNTMNKPLMYNDDWRKQMLKVVYQIQERSKWSGVCKWHFSAMKIRFLHDSHFKESWRILMDNPKIRIWWKSTTLMNENVNIGKWHSLKVWKPIWDNEICRIYIKPAYRYCKWGSKETMKLQTLDNGNHLNNVILESLDMYSVQELSTYRKWVWKVPGMTSTKR